jgi:hypothetical protein
MELMPTIHIRPTTADTSILPGACRKRERVRPIPFIRRVILIRPKIASDLISIGVSPHAVAIVRTHAVCEISHAPTMPRHVIEEPRAHRQAVFVEGYQ